jgi:hypothetical protein
MTAHQYEFTEIMSASRKARTRSSARKILTALVVGALAVGGIALNCRPPVSIYETRQSLGETNSPTQFSGERNQPADYLTFDYSTKTNNLSR